MSLTRSMAGALAGAYIVGISLVNPYVLGVVGWTVGGLAAVVLMDSSPRHSVRLTPTELAADIRRGVIFATREGFSNRNVRLFLCSNAIFGAGISAVVAGVAAILQPGL